MDDVTLTMPVRIDSADRWRNLLCHPRHARGPDGGTGNPHFADNMRELERILAMCRDDLAAEIATWPWVTDLDAR